MERKQGVGLAGRHIIIIRHGSGITDEKSQIRGEMCENMQMELSTVDKNEDCLICK